jgi:hypothetical protein
VVAELVDLVGLLGAVYLVDQVASDLAVYGQAVGEELDQSSQFLVDALLHQVGFVEQVEAWVSLEFGKYLGHL